ncbi:MAG: helix-hairpin-helix domain-containing protein [Chitinophagaceae bacterium]|nr:helix-hairpin-helix domain-containing protein [Chitinophagaceae bacterium]
MKWHRIILLLLFPFPAPAQEQVSPEVEQQLEAITEMTEEAETTDDSWWQQMEYLKKNKLNLNTASEADLIELGLLNSLQVNQLVNYKRLLGNFISIYELQAVPGWDPSLIQKLLPFITVSSPVIEKNRLLKQVNEGDYSVILRFSQIMEKAKGYLQKDSTRSYYAGDPTRLMLRCKYQYKNLLQYGFTVSKDAGEPLYHGASGGFDFYSFHFFAKNTGMVKAIALGDFTINLGQGLIHWQGFSFGSGGNAMHIKKQSAPLRPYNASGAFYFHRGAAVQIEKKNWQGISFLSVRNLDAKVNPDPVDGNEWISSIHTSGYHRTPSERLDKATLQQLAYGTSLRYKNRNWYSGFNMVQYGFNRRIEKDAVPYNRFALTGRHFSNYSLDYDFTYKNIHAFGEAAVDADRNTAFINGLLMSVHPKASLSFLYRNVAKDYQAFYGNAFTANSSVSNEKGIFAGLSLKPQAGWDIQWYAGLFHFPWLKYRTDAPSYSKELFVQVSYRPSKQTEIYSRYLSRQKGLNEKSDTNAMNEVLPFLNYSWRTQVSHRISKVFTIRHRFELLWYQPEKAERENGFLAFCDIFYKPDRSRISLNARLQYFESNGYNSRLYAYENDVLYYFAVPVFYDKGTRYYINLRYQLNRSVNLWIKWGQTIYNDRDTIGSGLDEIQGNKKSEIRILLSVAF